MNSPHIHGFFSAAFLLTLIGKHGGIFIQGPKFFSDNIKFKMCTVKQNQLHFFLICGLWIVHIFKCNGTWQNPSQSMETAAGSFSGFLIVRPLKYYVWGMCSWILHTEVVHLPVVHFAFLSWMSIESMGSKSLRLDVCI